MADLLRRIWSEDQAEDLAEYVLLVVVIGVVLVAAVQSFEGGVSTAFSEAISAL
jgi:Flp pilus assembly pilin Flp